MFLHVFRDSLRKVLIKRYKTAFLSFSHNYSKRVCENNVFHVYKFHKKRRKKAFLHNVPKESVKNNVLSRFS